MYIKSIVLDGFKSYGNRVEITGFDPEFNAITGLNGTGKSNILDSICFVLGITNLSNVRAGSLQELIYKHGQAGITKATVSITFDNSNRAQRPLSYEDCDEITVTRQVVMGGKNKYLINGVNVQNKKVSDLFCAVSLNVNNPHFLIMQGRITKVLNMKPPEILSMVEEAAGTRMYEAKKQAAQKTIEKKDAKLRELNDILREDIGPKLQKLQDERSQFQEYQKVVRELDSLTKLYTAWKYVSTEENSKQATERVSEVKQEISNLKNSIKENELQAKEIEKQVQTLTKKLDEESGNALKSLEEELSAAERAESVAAAGVKSAKEEAGDAGKRTRLLRGALQDDLTALQDKTNALEKVSSVFSSLKNASESATAALNEAQSRFIAVSTGLEGDNTSLHDRLIAAKQASSEASTRLAQISLEKKHCESRLKTLEKEFQGGRSQFDNDTVLLTQHQNKLDQIQNELSGLSFDAARYASLKESHRGVGTAVRTARDRREGAAGGLSNCDIQYSDPETGFNRRRVLGTVCRNFEVNESKYCTALETAAGGRLYNVIVDNEVTGRLLVDKGRLARRVTVIPLNQIRANVIPRKKLQLAQDIGGGPDNVQLALDVISYRDEVSPAMKFVFGSTLLCSNLDVARKVTFHPGVRARCVTVQGDVTDPGGSLSGGALPKGDPILTRLKQLRDVERELSELEAELQHVTQELTNMQSKADAHRALTQKQEMLSHELEVLKKRIQSSSHGQLHEEISNLRDQRDKLEGEVAEVKGRMETANKEAATLQREIDDINGHRDREFKKAEAALKKAKLEADKHGSSWKQRQQELETLKLEVTELESSVANSRRQLEEMEASGRQLEEALKQAQEQHQQALALVKEIQGRMKRHRSEMSTRSGEIAALAARKEGLVKANNETQLQIKQLGFNVQEIQGEAEELAKRIKSLETANPWISEERSYFGVAGGVYDFKGRGAEGAGARVAQLTARRDKLARGVNARAHTLLGKEEEQYQEVMRKKKIVEADRAKLVSVMEELDAKKRSTLVTACEQVNRDFGSIFSTLLPGAQARLQPPEGQTVLDGLEVKVGFNNTWKESLGELSGGQRSLVALSLVLAMLLFKPAPLYILDEVDAALDLSHTQNIGHMLREHFTHSQFIVVSLKDGMFNNANVLFRTQFVDGMSMVTRTVNTNRR